MPPTCVVKSEYGDHYNVIAMQGRRYCVFKIYFDYLTWDVARLLWIAFNKNGDNEKCLFDLLPKDLLKLILTFLRKVNTLVGDKSVLI